MQEEQRGRVSHAGFAIEDFVSANVCRAIPDDRPESRWVWPLLRWKNRSHNNFSFSRVCRASLLGDVTSSSAAHKVPKEGTISIRGARRCKLL